MQLTLKQHWTAMTGGRPGHRFQDRYAAAKKSRNDTSWAHQGGRILRLFVALIAVVIGVFLMVLPGPAVVFFFFAGTLLASESLYLARLLDWAEVKFRALWKWGKRHWAQAPTWGRAVLVTLGVCLSVTGAYVSYLVVRN